MPAKGGPRKGPMTDFYQSRRKRLEPKSLRVNRAWNLALCIFARIGALCMFLLVSAYS